MSNNVYLCRSGVFHLFFFNFYLLHRISSERPRVKVEECHWTRPNEKCDNLDGLISVELLSHKMPQCFSGISLRCLRSNVQTCTKYIIPRNPNITLQRLSFVVPNLINNMEAINSCLVKGTSFPTRSCWCSGQAPVQNVHSQVVASKNLNYGCAAIQEPTKPIKKMVSSFHQSIWIQYCPFQECWIITHLAKLDQCIII